MDYRERCIYWNEQENSIPHITLNVQLYSLEFDMKSDLCTAYNSFCLLNCIIDGT